MIGATIYLMQLLAILRDAVPGLYTYYQSYTIIGHEDVGPKLYKSYTYTDHLPSLNSIRIMRHMQSISDKIHIIYLQ